MRRRPKRATETLAQWALGAMIAARSTTTASSWLPPPTVRLVASDWEHH